MREYKQKERSYEFRTRDLNDASIKVFIVDDLDTDINGLTLKETMKNQILAWLIAEKPDIKEPKIVQFEATHLWGPYTMNHYAYSWTVASRDDIKFISAISTVDLP